MYVIEPKCCGWWYLANYLSSCTVPPKEVTPISFMEQLCKFLCGCCFNVDLQDEEIFHPTSYHVFLSHHGPDTKHTVVDVLRAFLQHKGITCFLDYRMTEVGDFPPNLRQAINNSRVHIVVLSPCFAESSWCLDEAAYIMELQRSKNKDDKSVLPIFYGIQPAAIQKHLFWSASELSKLHKHRTAATSFQGQMTERIHLRVEEFLCGSLRPYNAGLFKWESMYSSQMEQAEKALCSHASDNAIISIGILGRHRSQFAKLLFDRFCKDFHASCILLDVKKRAKSREGLLKLQGKLLSELANWSSNPPHFGNTERGLAMLLDRLKHTKCFIVIDDLDDNKEQLKSLLVLDKHRLGRGSRLVLTTRFPHVLHYQARIDETISLWPRTEDSVEESRKRLAICCESKDVHQGFIDFLCETFSALGLCVSVVNGRALLDVARKKQASLILVILSRSFNVDSPDVLRRLDEASTCPDVKLVYIFHGLQSGKNISLIPQSAMVVEFSVNFTTPSKCDVTELERFIITTMEHMQHEYNWEVRDFPVGLMKHQHKIENYICSNIAEGSKSKRIGIWGMGGIGKTTIAKSLFNKIHWKFDGSVFLLNVRAQSKDVGLVPLQKTILDSVLGADQVVKFSNSGQGSQLLSKWLRGTHTLVILDDVDHVSQLEALLDPLDLVPGSVVIITSRDRHILKAAGVDKVFEIDPLDLEDARKLFYWHAFLMPFPPIGLRDVAHEVIDACGGLPLALKVMGARVNNHNDHQFWEETLKHLKNAAHEIFKVLKVSMDALNHHEREAFLDICCFFVGKPHETARRVWRGCGWNDTICMDVLKSKCLIYMDPTDGTIGMHDQIRDMGRYIANQRQPFKMSNWDAMNATGIHQGRAETFKVRIWDAKDATDIPQDKMTLDQLRGFAWISQEEEAANCDALAMERLSRVKLLLLQNVQIDGGFSNLTYNQIRWLQWQHSPFRVLPPGLYCSEKLRVLDLSGSTQLESLWSNLDPSTKKVPKGLQELNLSGCKNLTELPQFDRFLRELEWFSLNGCQGIDHLDNSIRSLHKLKFLDLSGCTSLPSLPDVIQDLRALQKLLLSHCSRLDSLPQDIGRCCDLIEVCLDHTGLSTLPESFGDLKNLEKLTLDGCPHLASLPLSIGGLEKLRVCNLSDCPTLRRLPESFCELTNLEDLAIRNCDLEELPERIGNLHKLGSLSLEKNSKMRRLPPSMVEMGSLVILKMGFCPLQDDGMPEELERLESLEELDMRFTDLVAIPKSFAHLGKLSRLYLHHCAKLEEAAFFPSSLKFVDMGHCPRLQRVAGLTALKSLVHLVLCNCYQLRELSGLGGLDSLQSLNISGCGSLYSSL